MARETRKQLQADNEQLIAEAEEGKKCRTWMANRIIVLENKVRELENQISWMRGSTSGRPLPGEKFLSFPMPPSGSLFGIEPLPKAKPW